MLEFVRSHKEVLKKFRLTGTCTTMTMLLHLLTPTSMPCHLTICLCKPLYTSVQSRHIDLESSCSNISLVTTTSTALIPKHILDEVDTHDDGDHEENPDPSICAALFMNTMLAYERYLKVIGEFDVSIYVQLYMYAHKHGRLCLLAH